MANQEPLLWNKQSIEHEDKFRKFQYIQQSPYEVVQIGNYFVCKHTDFKISHETDNGTCVYIGLGMDGKEVAVKCMSTQLCEHLASNESKIYGLIKMGQSPHIARYLSYHKDREGMYAYIVLELCEYSLVEYVRRARLDNQLDYDPPKIIKGILTGLEELHKRGFRDEEMILHRDLKPDNVLFDVQNRVRLADFGVSKHIGTGRTTVYTSSKGNTEWQAAESIPNNNNDLQESNVVYKRKSDVQVAGMLAFYVITKGEHPFGKVSYERPMNIVEDNPDLNALTDPVEEDFVTWLIKNNIDERPFADEALKHPYLLSLDEQFKFLAAVGNENEVARNTSCDVVNELNIAFSKSHPIGWKGMIPGMIVNAFSRNRPPYVDNLAGLLRFMRNVRSHFNDHNIPEEVRQILREPAQYLFKRKRYFIVPMLVHGALRKQAKTIAQNGGSMESAWVNRPSLKPFF